MLTGAASAHQAVDEQMSGQAPDPDLLFRRLLACKGVMLAVSGGPDSTALMVLAARWRDGEGRDVPVCVATVDHGLRPEAADEAALVCANAAELGFEAVSLTADLSRSGSDAGNLQARAREARYRCLVEVARAKGFDTIATAHHKEDQAETFLIRLARGSGVYGLGAMTVESRLDGLVLWRPLLGVERATLHRIAAESGLSCVDDPSNEDPAFTRVRWRALLPELAANGLTVERIGDTARRMRRAADALDQYAGALLKENVSVNALGAVRGDAGFLLTAPDETALRALARLLQAVAGTVYTPRLDRIEGLLTSIRDNVGKDGGFRRTLNDCLVDLRNGRLTVVREWGRNGPPRCKAVSDTQITWDGRFELELPQDLADDLEIGALGRFDQVDPDDGDPAEIRTIPVILDGDAVVALPEMLSRAATRVGLPAFSCHSIVADRLFNPGSNRVAP